MSDKDSLGQRLDADVGQSVLPRDLPELNVTHCHVVDAQHRCILLDLMLLLLLMMMMMMMMMLGMAVRL